MTYHTPFKVLRESLNIKQKEKQMSIEYDSKVYRNKYHQVLVDTNSSLEGYVYDVAVRYIHMDQVYDLAGGDPSGVLEQLDSLINFLQQAKQDVMLDTVPDDDIPF